MKDAATRTPGGLTRPGDEFDQLDRERDKLNRVWHEYTTARDEHDRLRRAAEAARRKAQSAHAIFKAVEVNYTKFLDSLPDED